MLNRTIKLCPDKEHVTLTEFIPDSRNKKSDALLVIPGGGYQHVCADREGDATCAAFAALGVKSFWLNYSVGEGARFPAPLEEASLAMRYIKTHAEEYGIDPDRVFVLGYSAGGHLAGSLGTMWHEKWLYEKLGIPYGSNRPAGMVLCYPVLCHFPKTHQGTFRTALGTDTPTEEQIAAVSIERHVDGNTVPAFIWHTLDDAGVNVENSLRMISALADKKIYCEAHIYPHGPHGMALANADTFTGGEPWDERVAEWPRLAAAWMKTVKTDKGEN